MDILLTSEIFSRYFLDRSKFVKDSVDIAISAILENRNNRLCLSKALLNLVEDKIKDNAVSYSNFEVIIPQLINERVLNVIGTSNPNELELLKEMDNNYTAMPALKKRDIYFTISMTGLLSINKKNAVCVDKINKPNHHWIFFNLIAFHPFPIVLRYFDFNDNDSIKNIFDRILSISQSVGVVDLYDKQTNLEHNYFNAISNKSINYYTSIRGNRYSLENLEKIKKIKRVFRIVSIHNAKDSGFIHERRIVIKNLLLEFDDDFWNLVIERTTWKIEITYCPKTVLQIEDKKKGFYVLRVN